MTQQQPRLHLVSPHPKSSPKTATSEIELTIKEYLLALRQVGRTPGTLQKYGIRLDSLAGWLAERDVTEMADLSKLLLREWGASLNPEWSPATTRHALTIVRGWLNWLAREGLIADSLAGALRVPKVKSRIGRTLSDEEIQKLLAACDDSPAGLRDSVIVSLMVDSGLRATEVCRVKESDLIFDFQLKKKKVNFIPTIGKGGNEEPVYFGVETAAKLRAWLAVRETRCRPGVKTLFVSLGGITPGQPLGRFGLGILLRRLGKKAGVPGVTPHSLRRTFAVLLDDSGHTTRQIQALGRWSDIRMVERYTAAMRVGNNYHAPMDRRPEK